MDIKTLSNSLVSKLQGVLKNNPVDYIEKSYSSAKTNVSQNLQVAKDVLHKANFLQKNIPQINLSEVDGAFKNWTQTAMKPVNAVNDYLGLSKPILQSDNRMKNTLLTGPDLMLRNLRGLVTLLDIPSYAIGGLMDASRNGKPVSRNIVQSIIKKENPVFEQIPSALGMDPNSLSGMAVGLAAEVGVPDPGDAVRLAGKSDELAMFGKKLLSELPKEKRLNLLVNYGQELINRGFSRSQIDKLDVHRAAAILEKNLTPIDFEVFYNPSQGSIFSRYRMAEKLKINTSQKAIDNAEGMIDKTVTSRFEKLNPSGVSFKRLNDELKTGFENWVNKRRASKISGVARRKEFADLDAEGLNGIFKFQEGANTGRYAELRKFFDGAHESLKAAGVKVGYKDNYLTQLWANTSKEVQEVFQRHLTTKPSFSFKQVVESYKKGIEAGLTPRYTKLSDIAGWYEQRVQKSIADREFFRTLSKNSLIQPSNTAPVHWVTLDEDLFPKFSVKVGSDTFTGSYKAPEDVAKVINNYLRNPEGILSSFAEYAGRMKNIVLSAGVIKTGWNAHGFNILARNMQARGPLKGLLEGVYYLTDTKAAARTVDLRKAEFAVRHGLTISTEEHGLELAEKMARKGIPRNILGKMSDLQQAFFEKPLFEDVLPALKLNHFETIYKDFLSKGMDETRGAKLAAKITNEIYGGINIESFGRDKNLQNFFRSTILAADWAETNLKLGKRAAQSLRHPRSEEFRAYRQIVKNFAFIYTGASITNKLTSGHYMHENEAGHTMEIQFGTTKEGKARYLRPFGTSTDWIRLPQDIITGIAEGDLRQVTRIIANRLSIPAGVAVRLLANVNYRGQNILGPGSFGKERSFTEQAGAFTAEVSRLFTPPQVSNTIDFATGNIEVEEYAARLGELPVRYSYQLKGNKEKSQFELLTSSGMEPQQAVDRIKGNREEKKGFDLFSLFKRSTEVKEQEVTDPLLKALQKEKQVTEVNTKIKEIFEIAQSREEAEEMLSAAGLPDFQTASIGIVKAMGVSNGTRPDYIRETLTGLNNQEYQEALKFYITNKILTSGVVDYWEDEDMSISSEQAKLMKQLIKESKSTSISSGKRKIRVPAIKKLSMKATAAPKPIKSKRASIKLEPLRPRKLTVKKFTLPK